MTCPPAMTCGCCSIRKTRWSCSLPRQVCGKEQTSRNGLLQSLPPCSPVCEPLVEQRVGGLAGTREAAEILTRVDLTVPDERLLVRCQAYRRDTPREQVDRNEQARYIANLRDYDDRVRTLLYRFIKPTTTCYSVAGRLSAGNCWGLSAAMWHLSIASRTMVVTGCRRH